MAENPQANQAPDVFEAWRKWRDESLEVWAKNMAEYVKTEPYAQLMGAYVDQYLASAAPFQKALEQYMELTLPKLNMPTRDEVTSIAKRLTNVENMLDDIDVKLGAIAASAASESASSRSTSLDERLAVLEAKTTRIVALLEQIVATTAVTSSKTTTRSRKTGESVGAPETAE